jgi:hypothetical protein
MVVNNSHPQKNIFKTKNSESSKERRKIQEQIKNQIKSRLEEKIKKEGGKKENINLSATYRSIYISDNFLIF